MKRRSSSPVRGSNGGEQGFWPSYADMMSAVALILFFLMLLAYIQNMITGNNLKSTQQELDEALLQLGITQAQVEQAQKDLDVIFADLEIARQDVDVQRSQIVEQQQHIEDQAAYIAEQQANIAAQREVIAQQKALAEQQQIYLNDTQTELEELRTQMQNVALLRLSIVEQIRNSINQVMGDENTVTISENGSLVLSESVLFDRGSSDLKADSRLVLDQLAESFAAFLSDPDNIQYVDTIVIAGHADSTGGDELNRRLSTNRANAVLNYLLQTKGGALAPYAEYFCASGYGSTRPVADNSTLEGQARNRRIETSIIIKDDKVLDVLDQYLAIELPKG